jgi:threonine dehydrogenase-like Zn-dependent dehydrogenase
VMIKVMPDLLLSVVVFLLHASAAAVRVQASSKEHVPVAISGAGIAGLATAVALHKVSTFKALVCWSQAQQQLMLAAEPEPKDRDSAGQPGQGPAGSTGHGWCICWHND